MLPRFWNHLRIDVEKLTNSPDFPVGLELKNPTFTDFLARLGDGPDPEACVDLTRQLFNDIGWEFFTVGVAQLPALRADRRTGGAERSRRAEPSKSPGAPRRTRRRFHRQSSALWV